ncbi:cobyrinate a,c-diamide synthase [Kaistia dalseonensis]|uniref:Hydrogenobyrinate a,c-diamide synthase n=1 Tax=Kaistia dalseonensis TaxID=410840 RepID=A0ABU0HAD6_9HYPH|nr:cobyrinate a,c-diamide synthase [Kaistia dalseonensis]MCX5496657.1 cobyrinate a,c-diamide synthase [Kaistia dalseonensis]MDQ0439280.1 cobyrinic acid a,c-diamide synthase [Kaistia dalseonensis]
MSARGFILSAIRSGEGKTVLTTALLAALARRGHRVRSAKNGPDYVDPAFHSTASGQPSVNLDSWAMPPALLDALAADAAANADLFIVEGALGLFDGVGGPADARGATADIAVRLGLPVVLVLDVSGQSQTVAAILRGLAGHDPRIRVAGVILNRVASERHHRLIADAVAPIGLPILGSMPRDAALALPERHLGLVQAGEHPDPARLIAGLADQVERHVDIDALLALARPLAAATTGPEGPALPPPGSRIALAADIAFSFIYPHVLAGWRQAGAEIVPFSPLADEAPPDDCDACWLPGGYPELHAGRLAAASRFMTGLRHFAQNRPVHGECGGHMVLGRVLIDAQGDAHPMAGLLGHSTSFATRRLHLGYRSATIANDSALGPAGTRIAGHEFHYSTLAEAGQDAPLATITDARGDPLGETGGVRGRVSGSYFHAIARR